MHQNRTRFVPYGPETSLPIIGKAKVVLQCQAGKKISTTVYVVKGQSESLLGKSDGKALSIINIQPKGREPSRELVQRQSPQATVSGGQTQAEIDRNMAAIKQQFKSLFTGIGEIRVPRSMCT